jgi:hypothetical protein
MRIVLKDLAQAVLTKDQVTPKILEVNLAIQEINQVTPEVEVHLVDLDSQETQITKILAVEIQEPQAEDMAVFEDLQEEDQVDLTKAQGT